MTTVLVVDDETNLLDLVKGYLKRESFVVVTASDGPAAVDAARALRPDLVVLDLMLPGFDGSLPPPAPVHRCVRLDAHRTRRRGRSRRRSRSWSR
jgi:DNA-binding NarL/FixJ family response regulator